MTVIKTDAEIAELLDSTYGTAGLHPFSRQMVLSLIGMDDAIEFVEALPNLSDDAKAQVKGQKAVRDMIIADMRKTDPKAHGAYVAYRDREKIAAEKAAKEAAEAAAAAKRIAREQAWAQKGMIQCDRCGGAGGYKGWPGFTCYKCHGEGAYVATSRGDRKFLASILEG